MDELRERVERFVREHELIPAGGEVVCLVSGGADSTCLWHLLGSLGYRVSALHVNHKLRGSDSEEDARFCADALGAEVVELDGRGLSEAALREQRRSVGGDRLRATGHTASDQVETILYRLASSPSRRALLGMRPRESQLVRPLLTYTREQTAAYCLERGLRWREDQSNEDPAFARNRVRAELVPALRLIHPAAEQNVLTLSRVLRDEAAVLDTLVDAALDGGSQISLAALREQPLALQRLIVQRLADQAVGGPAPGVARRAEEIVAMGATAMLDLRRVRARTKHGMLRFERLAT